MDADRLIRRQRLARRFGRVVLVALLLLQVGYVSHLDEHAIGDTSDSCELCTQLDNNEHAVAAVPAALVSAQTKDPRPSANLSRIGYQYAALCRARAPPSV